MQDSAKKGGGGQSSFPQNFRSQTRATISKMLPYLCYRERGCRAPSSSQIDKLSPQPHCPGSAGQLATRTPVRNGYTSNPLLTLCSPLPERAPSESLHHQPSPSRTHRVPDSTPTPTQRHAGVSQCSAHPPAAVDSQSHGSSRSAHP